MLESYAVVFAEAGRTKNKTRTGRSAIRMFVGPRRGIDLGVNMIVSLKCDEQTCIFYIKKYTRIGNHKLEGQLDATR